MATPASGSSEFVVLAEVEVNRRMVENALKGGPRLLAHEQRIRLPFRWTKNPIANELEFLSMPAGEYLHLLDRARNLASAMRAQVDEAGDENPSLQFPETIDVWVGYRREAARWKAMLLSTVFDGGKDKTAQEAMKAYFAGTQTLGVTVARALGISERFAPAFERFALNASIPSIRLDPLTEGAILRLRADELLHAIRTANNAKVMEMVFFAEMAIIASLEMGLAQILLTMQRGGAGGLAIAEGLGEATAQGSFLAQGVFGGFMGFIGYLDRVGEVMADGEYTEDEEFGLNVSFFGIFLPLVFATTQLQSLPDRLKQVAGAVGSLTGLLLYAAAALNSILWMAQSVGELIEGLGYAEALQTQGVAALVAGDAEFEILIPPLP